MEGAKGGSGQPSILQKVIHSLDKLSLRHEAKEEEVKLLQEKVKRLEEDAEVSKRYREFMEEDRKKLQERVEHLDGKTTDEIHKLCKVILGMEGRLEELTGRKVELKGKLLEWEGSGKRRLEGGVELLGIIVSQLQSELLKGHQGQSEDSWKTSVDDQFLTISKDDILKSGFLNKLERSDLVWKNVSLEIHPDPGNIPFMVQPQILDGLKEVESLKLRIERKLDPSAIFHYLAGVLGSARKLKVLELELYSDGNWVEEAKPRWTDVRPDIQRELRRAPPPQLKRFTFLQEHTLSKDTFVKIIPAILSCCSGTLEDLELHTRCWDAPEMKDFICPKLRRLKVTNDGPVLASWRHLSCDHVSEFICRQPGLLEELDMTIGEHFGRGVFQDLWKHDKLYKLKTLRLVLQVQRSWVGEHPMAWNFLKRMTRLEEFSFAVEEESTEEDDRFGWSGSGDDILTMMPETIEKISFGGDDPKSNSGYVGPGMWPNNLGCVFALKQFKNLKELSLHKCLCFGNCGGANHFSFEGGATLELLPKLVRLVIEDCYFLNHEDLLRLVKSGSLKSFKYTHYRFPVMAINKQFLFRIVEQNPKLERVELHPFAFDRGQANLTIAEGHLRALEKELGRRTTNPDGKLELKTSNNYIEWRRVIQK